MFKGSRRTLTFLCCSMTLALLVACPQKSEEEAGGAKAEKAKSEKTVEPAKRPAPPKQTTETPEAPVVPPEVEHLENPDHKDMPTPKDMPELDTSGSEGRYTEVKKEYDAALAEACKAAPESVVRLAPGSRIGYVSYKNKNLTVPGYFSEAHGFGVFGEAPEARLVINPLSLDSGDPVRDRKLEKLFFELADAKNAVFVFRSTKIEGALPKNAEETSRVTITGDLTLHGAKKTLTLPFDVKKTGEGYEAKLATSPYLLSFSDFGLVEPLRALMKSCNHAAMGTAAALDITLKLASGCP